MNNENFHLQIDDGAENFNLSVNEETENFNLSPDENVESFGLSPNDEDEEFAVEFGEVINDGGTYDYNELDNKPQINGNTLEGNKTLDELGIQPKGDYLTEETDPTVPSYVKSITQNDITNWNNKADRSDIPDVSNFATKTELNNETTNRENADLGLQEQIDAITSSTDVKDIVGTYAELQNYDTSTLGNDDIVKVLQDNTRNNAMTYYRWIISGGVGSWQYIGQEGPYYTKSETETLLNNKQDEITLSNKLDSDLVNDTNQTNKFVTENEKTTWNTEIENLHEEDDLLKRNLQTTTGSGEEVTLENTTELDFVKPPLPRGNTKQDTTTGKNLLNTIDVATTTTNGVTYYRNEGTYYLSGTNIKTDAVWVLPNVQNINLPTFEIGQTYTMSVKGTLPNDIYVQLNAIKTSTGTQYNLGTIRSNIPSATFTIDSDYARTAQLFIGVLPAATNVDCNFSIQIEKGGTATSYEPYTGGIPSPNPDYPQEVEVVTGNVEVTISNENNTESKTLPVSLENIELCKIGNYQDYLYKNNGKWYKYNAINKLVLNGSEIWGLQSINSYGIANFQKSQPVDTIAGQANLSFCDTFSPQSTLISVTKNVGYFLNTAKVLFIRFDSSIANTAATFRTWLSQHNVTLYYVLGTATSTEITDATLISQLEEISKTLSYQGQTNITSNTIAMFDVEAYQDLKIILDEKYVKPSMGIPKTDLASAVQTSLEKADTALQSYTETDPTVPSYVKSITQANITSWNNKADVADIPTKLSELTGDSTHRLVTDTEKTTWNGKANISDIPKYYHGTCATAAATRVKVVECEGFVLEEGATISVTFTYAQTYNGSPQLNVNGTGAIVVQYKQGTAGIRYMWSAGEIIDFTYNGTYWVCHGRALATTTYYGLAKLSSSAVSTSTALASTPSVINATMENIVTGYDAYSTSATYEVGDRVRYGTYVYECIEAIPVKEAWTAAHWTALDPLQTQIDALEARIRALENS